MCEEWVESLSRIEVQLIERLADGATIAAAAAAVFLSLRTANRRMAALRLRSGSRTTREVVARYKQITGWGAALMAKGAGNR